MTWCNKQKVILVRKLKVYIIPHASQDARARDKESRKGRMADALALGGDEGRDKLR